MELLPKELKDVVGPGAFALVTALVAYVFGRQRYRREASSTELGVAQDSEQVLLMQTMREREQAALDGERRARELYFNAREELAKTRHEMSQELATLRQMGVRRDVLITRQGKQLASLAAILAQVRPELRDLIEASGFVAFDESHPAPARRQTDPGALPGPVHLDLDLR